MFLALVNEDVCLLMLALLKINDPGGPRKKLAAGPEGTGRCGKYAA
jgi:hypothetical protein